MNYEIPKSRDLDIHDLAIPKQDVVKVDIVSDIQPPTKEVIPLHEVAPHLDNSHMIEKKTPTSFSDVEIFMADRVDENSYDDIVILGDLVDDWGKGNDLDAYNETLDRAAEFGKEHDHSLWCYGNHDVSYLWDAMESGYSVQARITAIEGITRLERVLEDRYRFVHMIDDVLFSHAGLTESFVFQTCGYHMKEIEDILAKINRMGKQELWRDSSPIWARPQADFYRMFRDDLLYQVVGHTPVEEPLDACGVLTLDLFSTYSNGDPFGNQKLYIVDTLTRKFEEAK